MGIINDSLSRAIRNPLSPCRSEAPLSDAQREGIDRMIRERLWSLERLCEYAGYRCNLVIDPDGAK